MPTKEPRFSFVRLGMAAAVVAACAGVALAKDTAPSGPSAILRFTKGYQAHHAIGIGAYTIYRASSGPVCLNRKKVADLSIYSHPEILWHAPAGQVLRIDAHTNYVEPQPGVGVHLHFWDCDKAAVFTPEEGHTYTVTQKSVLDTACPLEIVDEATGKEPASIDHDPAQCSR